MSPEFIKLNPEYRELMCSNHRHKEPIDGQHLWKSTSRYRNCDGTRLYPKPWAKTVKTQAKTRVKQWVSEEMTTENVCF